MYINIQIKHSINKIIIIIYLDIYFLFRYLYLKMQYIQFCYRKNESKIVGAVPVECICF